MFDPIFLGTARVYIGEGAGWSHLYLLRSRIYGCDIRFQRGLACIYKCN